MKTGAGTTTQPREWRHARWLGAVVAVALLGSACLGRGGGGSPGDPTFGSPEELVKAMFTAVVSGDVEGASPLFTSNNRESCEPGELFQELRGAFPATKELEVLSVEGWFVVETKESVGGRTEVAFSHKELDGGGRMLAAQEAGSWRIATYVCTEAVDPVLWAEIMEAEIVEAVDSQLQGLVAEAPFDAVQDCFTLKTDVEQATFDEGPDAEANQLVTAYLRAAAAVLKACTEIRPRPGFEGGFERPANFGQLLGEYEEVKGRTTVKLRAMAETG